MEFHTAQQLAEDGWTIDRSTYPWTAYRGPRFQPEAIQRIVTPAWPVLGPGEALLLGAVLEADRQLSPAPGKDDPDDAGAHETLQLALAAWYSGDGKGRGLRSVLDALEALEALLHRADPAPCEFNIAGRCLTHGVKLGPWTCPVALGRTALATFRGLSSTNQMVTPDQSQGEPSVD